MVTMIPMIIAAIYGECPSKEFFDEINHLFNPTEIGQMLEDKYHNISGRELTYEIAKEDLDEYLDNLISWHNRDKQAMSRLWIDDKPVYKFKNGKFVIYPSTPEEDINQLRYLAPLLREEGFLFADVLILKILAFSKTSPALIIQLDSENNDIYYGHPDYDDYDEDDEDYFDED